MIQPLMAGLQVHSWGKKGNELGLKGNYCSSSVNPEFKSQPLKWIVPFCADDKTAFQRQAFWLCSETGKGSCRAVKPLKMRSKLQRGRSLSTLINLNFLWIVSLSASEEYLTSLPPVRCERRAWRSSVIYSKMSKHIRETPWAKIVCSTAHSGSLE